MFCKSNILAHICVYMPWWLSMLEPLGKKIGINSYRRPPSDNLMKPDGRLTNWEAPDNGTNKQMVDGTDNWAG